VRPDSDFERVDRLLDEALEQPPDAREGWLAEACGGDEALRARVAELLELSRRDDDLLTPGGGLAGPVAEALEKTLERQLEHPLEPGSRLGPFEVRELLGVGGMGRVYLARDPKLARNVAIKALSGALANEPSSLRRFEREARVLATLSHPNIASIHDLEVLDGSPYLILEYVEGDTLDEMLQRQIPRTDQVIEIALQILAALEEAHSKGIVHRDLKPSNVKIDSTGRVKVLDFGLARRMEAGGAGERGSGSVTGSGLVLGTAPYMSPEQARGDEVDARTDIWSFGCLLFELVTGRRAFQGRTVSDLLASVLRDPVDLEALPPRTPEELRRVLRRCLQKDPRRRYQHVGDIRVELAELRERSEPVSASRRPVSDRIRTTGSLPWAIAVAALAALVAVWLWRSPGTSEPRDEIGVQRFLLDLPPGLELPSGDYAPPMTLAPDGSAVALMASNGDEVNLYHRTLERLDWVRLPGTKGAWQPFFSSGGRDIGFFASGRLQRVALDGTMPISLAHVGANPRGATWTEDGRIVFGASHTSALSIVDARGGTPAPFTALDEPAGERSHRWPQALPGGEWLLFTVDYHEKTFDDAALALVSLKTRERRTVLRGGSHGRYLPSGHLLFARQGSLHAAPFEVASGRVTGAPRVVLEGIAYDLRNGGSKFAVSNDGTLAYVPDPLQSDEHRLVWRGVDGRREVITDEPRRYHDPALGPDGRRVALRVGDPMASDVWTLDLESGTLAQVTFGLRAFRPVWSPDGSRLALGVSDGAVWRLVSVGADGQAPAETLRESEHRLYPGAYTPDGRTLIFQERSEDAGWDLLAVGLDEDGRPAGEALPLLTSVANETNPALSPNGDFIAYESDEGEGPVNVYVKPFGRPGAKVDVSGRGGRWPHWGDGGELFYWSAFDSEMRRANCRVEGGRLLLESQEVLWPDRRRPVVVSVSEYLGRGFDLDPAGRRFLMLEAADAPEERVAPAIVLALRWSRELERGGR